MNKEFFQSIFSQKMGYVYRYTGTVPAGESTAHYITEQFAQAAGSNLVNTVVTELINFGIIVIYNYATEDTISNSNFELITDLVPDPIPEPPVLLEPPQEETPPTEEPSQG
jgi:citrate lyase synthetase